MIALCQDLATNPCLQGQQAAERNGFYLRWGWGVFGNITATTGHFRSGDTEKGTFAEKQVAAAVL